MPELLGPSEITVTVRDEDDMPWTFRYLRGTDHTWRIREIVPPLQLPDVRPFASVIAVDRLDLMTALDRLAFVALTMVVPDAFPGLREDDDPIPRCTHGVPLRRKCPACSFPDKDDVDGSVTL